MKWGWRLKPILAAEPETLEAGRTCLFAQTQGYEPEQEGDHPGQHTHNGSRCDTERVGTQDEPRCEAERTGTQDESRCEAETMGIQDGSRCEAERIGTQDGSRWEAGGRVQM